MADANLFGSSYHVVVDDVEGARTDIAVEFKKMGRTMPPVEEVSPNLEDLFVSFAGGGMAK